MDRSGLHIAKPEGHIPSCIRGGGGGDSPVETARRFPCLPQAQSCRWKLEQPSGCSLTDCEPVPGPSTARGPEETMELDVEVGAKSSENKISGRQLDTKTKETSPSRASISNLKRKRTTGRPRLDRSFYLDPPPPPVPVTRILAWRLGSLSEGKLTPHKRRGIRRRDHIKSESNYSDDGGDRPTPWVEVPATFFKADQRKRMKFELQTLRRRK